MSNKHTRINISWGHGLPTAALLAAFGLNTAQAAFDVRLYLDITRDDAQNIDTVLNDPDFPDNPDVVDFHFAAPEFTTPEATSFETSGLVEWPQQGPGNAVGGDSGNDNYGGAISGILYPPQTGTYRFHIRSDDESALYFNPTPIEGSAADFFLDPEADGVEPVALEPTCCGGFEPLTSANETSVGFELEVGKAYAIEVIWQEGGGGDWVQVGWSYQAPGATTYTAARAIPAFAWQRDVRYGDASADGITSFGDDLQPIVAEGDSYCCIGVEFDKDGAAEVSWEVSYDEGDSWEPLTDDGNFVGTGSPSFSIAQASAEFPELFFRPTVDGEVGEEILFETDEDDDAPEIKGIGHRGNPGGFIISVNERVNPDSIDASKIRLDGAALPAGTDITLSPSGSDIFVLFDRSVFEYELDSTHTVLVQDGAFTDIAFAENENDEISRTFLFGGGEGVKWDFNDESSTLDDWALFGNAVWRPTGGVGDSGYLSITDGAGGQAGAAKLLSDDVVVTDQVIFSFMARIGDASGRPADGYSFNVANDIPDAVYPQSEEGYTGGEDPASFGDGLSVNFDNWASGGVDTGVGFEVKYNGQFRHFTPSPDIRANAEVTESAAGIPTIHRGERWFPVVVDLRADGTATITYDGIVVMDAVDVGWTGIPGGNPQVGFGGRTGGAWQSHWFDDLEINTAGGAVGDITIAEQPEDQTGINEFDTFTFAVTTGGGNIGLGAQWFKDGEAIPGATLTTYSGTASPSMAGVYSVVVNNWFSEATSEVATLTVVPDTAAPEVVSAGSSPLLTDVFVTFDENVDISGATFTVSAVQSGAAVSVANVTGSGASVTLQLGAELAAGTRYEVAYENVVDLSEQSNSATGSTRFLSNARIAGGMTVLFYELAGGGLGFLADAEPGEYPEGFARFGPGSNIANIRARQSTTAPYFETPATGNINTAPPGDIANNYALIAFAWLKPEVSGDYRFFLASDDNAQLWLSTDADPSNAELIANEPGWNGVRQYDDGKEDNWSDPIALEAGEEYYIEARNSEGGGGDNLAVAWTFTTDGSEPPVPSNGSNPIPGEFLISNLPIFDEITISGASPASDGTGVLIDSGNFSVDLVDGFTQKVNPETVSVTVGGATVEVAVATEDGSHTVTGSLGTLPINATVNVVVSFETTEGVAEEITYSFRTENLPTLNPGWAVGLDQGTERGFNVRSVQWNVGRGNNTGPAEAQLATPAGDGRILFVSEDDLILDLINFNQDADGGSAGNGVFRGGSPTAAYQIADDNLAEIGLIDPNGNTDNFAIEATTFLAFPEAGIYTMGVNSDDGFRVTSGISNSVEDSALQLGVFDGGRGAANDAFQSTFRVNVTQPGIYAVRFITYEGGGGASAEWYSIDGGTPYLINDDSGILAYVGRATEPSPVVDAEITSISADAGNVTIEYTGTLQSASAVEGPYSNVAGASSPYTFTPDANTFFRVQ